ncbi:MAG: hypothetical protein AB7E37_00035 [Candidatus Altimarinota bacterium]
MLKYIKFDLFLQNNFVESENRSREEVKTPVENKEPDLSHLSPEDRERIEKIQEKIKVLENELQITNAGVNVVGARKEVLEGKSDSQISFRELSEDGAYQVNERVLKLKGELLELKEQKQILLRGIEVAKANKLSDSEIKSMQAITSKEFLSTPANERLRFITQGNIEAKNVKEGGEKALNFTFTFDGKFNRELYIRTTAGQILPENVRTVTSGNVEYTRTGLNGEFFSNEGKRLLIHEGTQLEVVKFGAEDELKQIQENLSNGLKEYKGTPHEELALESLKKGYDPKFVISLFGDKIASLSVGKKETIEDKITDIARLQDDFQEDYPSEKAILEGGKPSEKFSGYVVNSLNPSKISEVSQIYGYNLEVVKQTRRANNPSLGGGPMNLENINIEGISKEEVDAILNKQKFTPGSKDAQVLFLAACQAADLPKDWCNKESLHRILSRESNGMVGRLNYTIKGHSVDSFKEQALSSTRNNPIGTVSTASGLGQLLLSNVDKYYPEGRKGIGDPLNEAVGMLRYIKDRYGNPDIAWSVYGKTGNFDHPQTGRQYKGFAEGY